MILAVNSIGGQIALNITTEDPASVENAYIAQIGRHTNKDSLWIFTLRKKSYWRDTYKKYLA